MSNRTRRAAKAKIIKLLIVDDHPIVRHGLRGLFENETHMEVCGEASSTAEALQIMRSTKPDVAIVDISLGDSDNGLGLVETLSQKYPNTKTLVSSLHDEEVYAPRALRAGSMGYISKQESIEKIAEAIRQIVRNEVYLSPAMANRLLRKAADREPLDQNPLDQLTPRELEVFEMIGRGLTVRTIGRKLGMKPKTVETHRRNIRTKLELSNSIELYRTAFQWAQKEY